MLAWQQDDLAAARAYIEEALTIHRAGDEPAELAAALEMLGRVALSSRATTARPARRWRRRWPSRGRPATARAAAECSTGSGNSPTTRGQYERARAWPGGVRRA